MSTLIDSSFLDQVYMASFIDSFVFDIKCHSKYLLEDESKFKFHNDLLYFKEHLYISDGLTRLCVLQIRHDLPAVEHFEFNKTLKLLF